MIKIFDYDNPRFNNEKDMYNIGMFIIYTLDETAAVVIASIDSRARFPSLFNVLLLYYNTSTKNVSTLRYLHDTTNIITFDYNNRM